MKKIALLLMFTLPGHVAAGALFLVEEVTTNPTNPSANLPFEIVVEGGNSGCWRTSQGATVNGRTIAIDLAISGCGPDINPWPFVTFVFQMLGLPRGQYSIEVFLDTAVNATNPLQVTGVFVGPRSIPAIGWCGMALLAISILLLGYRKRGITWHSS